MLEVKVTQEHIDKGQRGEGDACPIALALLKGREYKQFLQVFVDVDNISFDDELYRTSRKATKFIEDFDNGKEVKPATFRFLEL